MRAAFFLILAFLLGPTLAAGQSGTTVFKGLPTVKVSEGGLERTAEQISRNEAINLACVISKIGDSYYWASRENVELARVDGGAFITFVAVDGSGYVRIVKPELKSAASLMGPTEEQFDYVEHLLLGLRSVTYYGAAQE